MKMKSLRLITALWTLLMLVACGGGGSVSRDETPTPTQPTEPGVSITLDIVNQSNQTDRNLTISNPLTVIATVTTSTGTPVADQLVRFSVEQADLLVFGNDTGTARTNAEGIATIGITVGAASGDGEITASLSSGVTGSTTFSSAGSGSTGRQPAQLALYASSLQLPSSGSDEVELIAVVKDAQSVLMEGIEVNFAVSNDAEVELQLTQPVTAEDGTARAILTSKNNAGNRTFEVTAQAGSFNDLVEIKVDGTEVVINGPSSLVLNDSAEYTLRIQDSDGNAIANQMISLSATSGTLNSNTVRTEANGQAAVTYTATQSGPVTINAQVAELNAQTDTLITVQEDEFVFVDTAAVAETRICNAHDERETASIPECEINSATDITVNWQKDGSPNAGANVTFTASRGEIINGTNTVVSDAQGNATFTITSNNAGRSSITATGFNDDGDVVVTARMEVEFVATDPYVILVDASPDILGPDGQTSTITALVRDQDSNLVKNAVITFNVNDSSTGTLSPSQATTDSNGVASTVFTSGAVNSLESVLITATSLEDGNVAGNVTLTVGNRAFDISMGTGNLISSPDNSTYLKEFAVFVADSAGRPVADVNLTASLSPVRYPKEYAYRKGSWFWDDEAEIWYVGYNYYVPATADEPAFTEVRAGYAEKCINEDINNDGILDLLPVDPDTGIEGEDLDADSYLTPGIIGALSFQGEAVTDENGQATLELRYPREYGMFYTGVITVNGQSTGSEASASMVYTYSVAGDDIDEESVAPPASPWGAGTPYGETHPRFVGTTENCTVADNL
ncbi:Ig-like domain-containing protein [Alteromonas gilva]|uniref:Ig-like domain-containing protein n=1 Tax=Alteromonas gilva TaxID=2987522 RepID=A0ABT5L2M0_9ALTE|nr:Ig-like domain-containing protein [Alteromonas gilva]MDC8831286.1 Ig-like domain-containing protein [Alteromonas gilva]